MWLRLLLALSAVLAMLVVVATATAGGGNSDNAHMCQKGGWMGLFRSDGSSFASQGECVSYGAHGGTLTTKTKTKSQLDCEAFGGTFTVGGTNGFQPLRWQCTRFVTTDNVDQGTKAAVLDADCFADGSHGAGGGLDPGNQQGGYPLTFTVMCFL